LEIDADLIYNATVIESILASILSVDIKTIVKVRLVHKIICTLWEENNWDTNTLTSYILENKPTVINPQPIPSDNNNNNNIITDQPTSSITSNTILLEEAPSEEIEMTENDQAITTTSESTIEETYASQDIIGKDITMVTNYDIRNRKLESMNPFYITKSKNFRLGVLSVNTPGDNNKEQLAFIANMLKLPSNSDLVQFEFLKGNSWITTGFDYEEDLTFCKDKLNRKDKDLIKFIQLHPAIETKEKSGKDQQHPITNNQHNHGKMIIADSNIQTAPSATKLASQNQNSNNKSNKKEENISPQKRDNNPYSITERTTSYQGGFLSAKIPGENRKEQLDYTARLLKIPTNNNLITPTFHEGNSWITAYFPNQDKLDHCLETINNQSNNIINMIALNISNKKYKSVKAYKEKEHNITKHFNPTQTYNITDIPLEYSNNRIKGSLKPFGKITDLRTLEARNNAKEKTVQVTIEPLSQSKDISNRWSIPLGSIMARVAPAEVGTEIWKDRNQYTARLYGIPKATNTVILMRAIKNLKPKTCYIPKCSISGKERSFAIISFQTKEDLDKACISSAKYLNHTLTWSKSRIRHNKASNINSRKTSQTHNKHDQELISDAFSSASYNNKETNSPQKSNTGNLNSEESSVFSISSPSIAPSTSTSTKSNNIRRSAYKGKGKLEHNTQEDNTTDKIIAMISQIASRLDQIENNMGILPNRS
jgi:hypothetical protein